MNLIHGTSGSLDKLQRGGDLQKDHCHRAGLAIRDLASVIVEADPNNAEAVKQMLAQFLRALAAHDATVEDGRPQEAAERLARETDRIIRERALAASLKSSLQKGYAPQDFFRR
jgi:phage terminase Nu1 subunit (DNA packaging protein)